MADDPTEDETGGSGRCTGAEADARVGQVAELLAQRKPRREILQFVSDSWGLSERAGDWYIARARAELAREVVADVADARAQLIAMLELQYRNAMKAGDIKSAIAATREIGKLLGLYAPATAGKVTAEDGDAKARRLLADVYDEETD